ANKAEAVAFFEVLDANEDVAKTESGLRFRPVEEGSGDHPGAQDTVVISYRGTLIDGTEFDSNTGISLPLQGVVPGFREGLQLMKEGGRAKLYIPSELGYGDRPQRPGSKIEPGSTIIFDVHLLRIEKETSASYTPPDNPRRGGPPGPPP